MSPAQHACVAEPISFLRLERYRLHELSAGEERAVAEHLAHCAVCRASFASIEEDGVLPELPAAAAPSAPRDSARIGELIELRGAAKRVRARRFIALSSAAGSALALAAAALLMLKPPPDRDGLRPSRIGVKGGDVALELVRNHRGALASDTSVFAPGDAFKVLVTCPPPLTPHFDVVVYQAGQAYFPLASGALSACGNRQALTGAFSLDGTADAVVCVALDAQRAPLRAALRNGPSGLPALSVCTRVAPDGTTR